MLSEGPAPVKSHTVACVPPIDARAVPANNHTAYHELNIVQSCDAVLEPAGQEGGILCTARRPTFCKQSTIVLTLTVKGHLTDFSGIPSAAELH